MKKYFIIPLFIVFVSLFALIGDKDAQAFEGSYYDLDTCGVELTTTMLNYMEADYPSFNRNNSQFIVGYYPESDNPSYRPLMIITADKNDTGSQIVLDYNSTTEESSIRLQTGTTSPHSIRIFQVTNILGDNSYPTLLGTSTNTSGTRAGFTFTDVLCVGTPPSLHMGVGSLVRTTSYDTEFPGDDIPAIDVDYRINFSYANSGSTLTATYKNKVTDPTTSLPDPRIVWWQLRDKSDPDGTAYEATVVCEATRPIRFDFSITEVCPDFTPDPTHEYILVGKVNPLGNGNEDLNNPPGYDINFIDTWFSIDFSKTTAGDSTNCEPGALPGLFTGLNCIAPETIDFAQCFSPDFPFVDPFECADSMTMLLNLLSFKTLKIGNDWSASGDCRNLVVLGDWISQPGISVCPQIPGFVRTIVTPFVTFALGLITVKFLTRKEGYLQ